ncbi:hypothetical protein BH11PLA1_BH11PLA1_18620 [soil metagenome]
MIMPPKARDTSRWLRASKGAWLKSLTMTPPIAKAAEGGTAEEDDEGELARAAA